LQRPVDDHLADAVEHVLETMCFSQPAEDPGPFAPIADPLAVKVAFDGQPSGEFHIVMSGATARLLACAFLGAEPGDLAPVQVSQVTLELANMLCGCYLSRMETCALFDLNSPEISPSQSAAGVRRFLCEEGPLEISILLHADSRAD
jgi:CheY-specific phosphatase CheX